MASCSHAYMYTAFLSSFTTLAVLAPFWLLLPSQSLTLSPPSFPLSLCLSLSSLLGELYDLDAASLQLKVINYVSGGDCSYTPTQYTHTHTILKMYRICKALKSFLPISPPPPVSTRAGGFLSHNYFISTHVCTSLHVYTYDI